MTVTILIKRKMGTGNEDQLKKLYRGMRIAALNHKGYVGGETLKRVDQEGELLVISRWKHIDNWSRWLISKERRVYQEQIDALTGAETEFEIYVH